MEIFSTEGWYFLLRWIHFLAGITWIGILYYFNFVQTPFFATELGGQARGPMIRGLVGNALWWFRWGAMITFLSGWIVILSKFAQAGAGTHGALLTGDYMTLILTGGLLGSLMWYNVWFVIWPAQKVVIASAEQVARGGEAIAEAARLGARAGLASRTNTLFSIPMLFFMASASHFTSLYSLDASVGVYWVVVLLLAGAVEANALVGKPGTATTKPLASVSGTIHAGLGLAVVLYLAASIVL